MCNSGGPGIQSPMSPGSLQTEAGLIRPGTCAQCVGKCVGDLQPNEWADLGSVPAISTPWMHLPVVSTE